MLLSLMAIPHCQFPVPLVQRIVAKLFYVGQKRDKWGCILGMGLPMHQATNPSKVAHLVAAKCRFIFAEMVFEKLQTWV